MHLMLAALTWTIVGAGLLFFGVRWVLPIGMPWLAVLITVALIIGLLKARFALSRAADRVITRILVRGNDRCLGGFFSWKTWLMVALMITTGRLIRASGISMVIVGVVYAAVGIGLVYGARHFWLSWHRQSNQVVGEAMIRPPTSD